MIETIDPIDVDEVPPATEVHPAIINGTTTVDEVQHPTAEDRHLHHPLVLPALSMMSPQQQTYYPPHPASTNTVLPTLPDSAQASTINPRGVHPTNVDPGIPLTLPATDEHPHAHQTRNSTARKIEDGLGNERPLPQIDDIPRSQVLKNDGDLLSGVDGEIRVPCLDREVAPGYLFCRLS